MFLGLQDPKVRGTDPDPSIIKKKSEKITINVPVVYMGRYKVVLRGDYP